MQSHELFACCLATRVVLHKFRIVLKKMYLLTIFCSDLNSKGIQCEEHTQEDSDALNHIATSTGLKEIQIIFQFIQNGYCCTSARSVVCYLSFGSRSMWKTPRPRKVPLNHPLPTNTIPTKTFSRHCTKPATCSVGVRARGSIGGNAMEVQRAASSFTKSSS